MDGAAAQYLKEVNKKLCCPGKLKRSFLRQLKEAVRDYCTDYPDSDLEMLTIQFGKPEDIAADFFTQTDPCAVSRFAYNRLRFAYLLLAVVVVAALSVVTVRAVDYVQTQQLIADTHAADTFVHPDGTVCNRFWVRTNYRGEDIYWEYHSCIGQMCMSIPPEDSDGTEPYAVDIYLNNNGTLEHWTFGQEHMFWIRVWDTDIQKEG